MLSTLDSSKLYHSWIKVYRAAILCVFIFFTLLAFSPTYVGSLYCYVYKLSAIALICSFLFFRRLRDGTEFKLIFAYCLWLVIVRIIDGGISVPGTKDFIINQLIALPLLGFAILIPSDRRLKWLDIMATVYCVFYTVIGIFCLYGAIYQIDVINPIETNIKLCYFPEGRLYVFEHSCNDCGIWYFTVCAFLVYLFFRYKQKVLRFLMVLSFIICYMVLALTYSRSCTVSFAVSAAMLVALLVIKRFSIQKPAHKAIVFIMLMCLCTPLVYKSFEVTTRLMSNVSVSVLEDTRDELLLEETSEIHNTDTSAVETAKRMNSRSFNGTGRVELWVAAIRSLLDDTDRIITGSLDSMALTNQAVEKYLPEQYDRYGDRPHHHNSYLEFLMNGGLPGFLLMMAFFIILLVKMVRIFFSESSVATLAVKSLTLMLAGHMVHNLVQTSFFHIYYVCTVIFCVVAGYILAFEKEICRENTSA